MFCLALPAESARADVECNDPVGMPQSACEPAPSTAAHPVCPRPVARIPNQGMHDNEIEQFEPGPAGLSIQSNAARGQIVKLEAQSPETDDPTPLAQGPKPRYVFGQHGDDSESHDIPDISQPCDADMGQVVFPSGQWRTSRALHREHADSQDMPNARHFHATSQMRRSWPACEYKVGEGPEPRHFYRQLGGARQEEGDVDGDNESWHSWKPPSRSSSAESGRSQISDGSMASMQSNESGRAVREFLLRGCSSRHMQDFAEQRRALADAVPDIFQPHAADSGQVAFTLGQRQTSRGLHREHAGEEHARDDQAIARALPEFFQPRAVNVGPGQVNLPPGQRPANCGPLSARQLRSASQMCHSSAVCKSKKAEGPESRHLVRQAEADNESLHSGEKPPRSAPPAESQRLSNDGSDAGMQSGESGRSIREFLLRRRRILPDKIPGNDRKV
eukprot:TRINITY_DN2982_c0_g1_i4.p1 TRINITY_DN2982_c0_g1~~TRINITY_DN2982_c0_g1_i4.p1  ORF type:complete len:447 (-),score=70.74 TRINITY_DN2982_c0_g1_i4:209-1549(-)